MENYDHQVRLIVSTIGEFYHLANETKNKKYEKEITEIKRRNQGFKII